MPAYVIVDVDVHDPAVYKEYRARAAPTVVKHGGRYLVRGGDFTHVEPGWDLHRFVILEFSSVEKANAWYRSEDYRKVLPLRLKSAKSKLTIVQGLEAGQPLPP